MLKVGQVVYLVESRRFVRPDTNILEWEIATIGRKYFYVNNYKFRISDLKHIADSGNSRFTLYLSKQDIADAKEKYEIISKINKFDFNALSLEQLRIINEMFF